MTTNTIAIIQARMGSTRLPGKILKSILGEPMLARMLERVKSAKRLDAIILATTDKPEDDQTATLAQGCGVKVFRGDEKDVLDRFYKAAQVAEAKTVVRLTGDCPLHDFRVIDEVVERFFEKEVDYVSTPQNYPEGLDTEVFSFKSLQKVWQEANLPSEREHVSLYIKNHPELFRLGQPWVKGLRDDSSMHWSVDTERDFNFVTKIFGQLYIRNPDFSKNEVLALLTEHPEFLEINKGGTGYEGLAKSLAKDEEFKKLHT